MPQRPARRANTDISYDGTTLYDDFDLNHLPGTSDVGTQAESGTNNDWAIVYGPPQDNTYVGLANDSAASDKGDFALYEAQGAPTSVYSEQGATILNATNSDAEVFGGGNAEINGIPAVGVFDPVTNSAAIASNGGFAGVENDGLAPNGVSVTNDFAFATGTAVNNTGVATTSLGTGVTPSVANIYDSGYSDAYANGTGSNLLTGEGGAAVNLANNSFSDAMNPGSAADISGTGTQAVVNSSNIEPDGDIYGVIASNTAVFDGTPDATFFADLFGAGGTTAMTADWTALLAAFGI